MFGKWPITEGNCTRDDRVHRRVGAGCVPRNVPPNWKDAPAVGETDCVAGVVGLELRNPLGSKSAGVAGEFQPLWPQWRSRDGSRSSCGVTDVQLRQGFRVVLRARRLTLSPGSCFCPGSALGRHLMGFERIGRPIYGGRGLCHFPDCGLT
jgi:hypothetical protein